MWWEVSHFGGDEEHAAVAAALVVDDVVVVHFGFWFDFPAEEVGVEFDGLVEVFGVEFVPGHGSGSVDEVCAFVFFGLPEGDVGSGGVLECGHSS